MIVLLATIECKNVFLHTFGQIFSKKTFIPLAPNHCMKNRLYMMLSFFTENGLKTGEKLETVTGQLTHFREISENGKKSADVP
ncbi:hypothetical protein BpJC4_28060 [Weizmannia acidilactici]|nr:hypothetical protein [Weizmannia acidilactici]GER68335.1 hypothetical protein BpJC4_28060 [Weizmannia acidilactici]GER74691.1 hypothetical protein BpPP18_27580 [Weizmannia acidilactici]